MSRIYFHTPTGDAEVSGSERASFGVFCESLAWTFLDYYAEYSKSILSLFPPHHYIHGDKASKNYIMVAFQQARGELCLNGKPISPFALSLNTAYAIGNDAVRLAARIHGQCEIHCWTKGENRKWLAGIVQQGLARGFYRAGMGWDDVISLLLSADDSPAVMSYSVCEQFPNQGITGFYYDTPVGADGEPDYDAWYDLSEEDQWYLAMKGLEAKGGSGLELSPDTWDNFFFDDGYTAMDLARDLAHLS